MLVFTQRTARYAVLIAVVLSLAIPAAAVATPGLTERSDSTFRLHPGQNRIKTDVVITLTNRKPASTSIAPCSAGSAQRCRFRTNYFWNKWGNVYVPAGATKVRFSSPGLRTSVAKKTKHWTSYLLTFPNLNFGQTRRVKVSYELPGGKPRSKHRTRVMDAYTYFCWHGEPGDTGKVSVVLPPGYEATTFFEKIRTKKTKKHTTIIANFKGDPSKVYACTDAYKPSKLLRTELTSPGGQLVTVEGWPEDPEWSEQMAAVVTDTLPKLESLIGRPLPLDDLTIREVSEQSLYGYGSNFGIRHAVVRLGEHIDNTTSAPSGLASAWFNGRKIKDQWLDFALTNWAGNQVSQFGCWPVAEYPGKGKPNLSKWKQLKDKPSETLEAVVDWQYDAACNIIDTVEDQISDEQMHAVLGSLLDGTPKYGPQPAERNGKFRKATWKDWLDAADELGLVPAGVDDLVMAENALKDHGIARARDLKGRAKARAAYHEALATMDGTHLPYIVNDQMGRWKFGSAMKALPIATQTYQAIMANPQMSDEDREAYLVRFVVAKSLKGLRSLASEAASFEPAPPDVEPAEAA
jgi:hypothetical protein